MKTVKVQHPTIGSFYQVTMSERELLALISILRVLKMGFSNWLARKGKATQETQYCYVREAESIVNQLEDPIAMEDEEIDAGIDAEAERCSSHIEIEGHP